MIHVAFAADEAYLPHAAALLRSLVTHNDPTRVTLHFLHLSEFNPPALATLRDFADHLGVGFRNHPFASERLAGLPAMGRIPPVMWLRAFLPEVLPAEPRVLYLDCDTIVMDQLDALWSADLGGAPVGAVSNVFEAGQEHRALALGLKEPRDYFNSGVLLLDLNAWRRENAAAHVLALARGGGLVWPDQDALNKVFAGRWHALDARWNCQNSLYFFPQAAEVFGGERLRAAQRAPGILHFEGGELAKPWHYLCKHPLRTEYLRHRAATPWPLANLEGRTVLNRLLRPLPIRWLLPVLIAMRRAQSGLRRRLAWGRLA